MHRKDWQEELLAAGILGVLKGWLEPIRGSLPLLEVWVGLIRPHALNFSHYWQSRDAATADHTSFCSKVVVSHMGACIRHAAMRVLQGLPKDLTADQHRFS